MDFNLKKPCKDCPFKTDTLEGWLGGERAEEISNDLIYNQGSFTCHKTLHTAKQEHCAGALILLEKLDRPNQMMRIAERLGYYDRTKLVMDSDVFEDQEGFIDRHTD